VELDALLGDVAVAQQNVGTGLPVEEHVQLREPEAERFAPVDERDVDLVAERFGESRRQFQAREASPKDHDVPLHLERKIARSVALLAMPAHARRWKPAACTFVVHHGQYVLHHVAGRRKPMSSDVVVAHRLSKNAAQKQLGVTGHALFTREWLNAMGLRPETLELWRRSRVEPPYRAVRSSR
jgi:Protein of unknown function (DUF2652)